MSRGDVAIIHNGKYLRFALVLFKQQLPVIDVYFFKRNLQMKKSLVLVAMFAIVLAACSKKEEAKLIEATPAASAEATPATPATPATDAKK